MTRFGTSLAILLGASLGVAGCTDSVEGTNPDVPPPGSTTGGDGNTFDHENDGITVWELVNRLTTEGPATFSSQMHSCAKMQISTLGTVLTSLGVNLNNNTAGSAGQLFKTGTSSMGAASYVNRIRENAAVTAAQAQRLFDIGASAASEIITAMPTLARCQVGGAGPAMFDASNQCTLAGITCLIGTPATQTHVDLCNQAVAASNDVATGKRLAVAAMFAAAYTCM